MALLHRGPKRASFARAFVCALTLLSTFASSALGGFRDSAPLFDKSPHVETLTKSTFDRLLVSTSEVWIIDFYSPWCPYCRDFAPQWETIAAFYADIPHVHVGAIDCTSNHAVCAREKIVGYPAMKLFHVPATAVTSMSYTGAKNVHAIIQWIEASLQQANMPSGIALDAIAARIERAVKAKKPTATGVAAEVEAAASLATAATKATKEAAVAPVDTAAIATLDTTTAPHTNGPDAKHHELTPADQLAMPGGRVATTNIAAVVAVPPAAAVADASNKPDERSLVMKYARLRDAGAVLVFALEDALFIGVDVLDGERLDAALQWIDALAASFPLETNRAVFVELGVAARRQRRWDQSAWLAMLAQWKATSRHSTFPRNLLTASTDDNGSSGTNDSTHCNTYTCGLWTLFHSMSVGVDAPLRKGSQLPTHAPSEVAAAIRTFIQHFFGCENCVKHFLAANPPTAMAAMATHDSDGPQTLIVWLWRMHNKVNKVTKKGFWPSVRECPDCYADGVVTPSFDPATLHDAGIAAYVRSVYAQNAADVFAMNYATNGVVAVLTATLADSSVAFFIAAAACFLVMCGALLRTQSHRFAAFQYTIARAHAPRPVRAKRCS